MSTKMRTEFTVEEMVRLISCGIGIDLRKGISLAAVEAECIDMAKRKWPRSRPCLILSVDEQSQHPADYTLFDLVDSGMFRLDVTSTDRAAALVELVENIVEAK